MTKLTLIRNFKRGMSKETFATTKETFYMCSDL